MTGLADALFGVALAAVAGEPSLHLGAGPALLMASPFLVAVAALVALALASRRRHRRQEAAAAWAEDLRDTVEQPAAGPPARTGALPTSVVDTDGAEVHVYPPAPHSGRGAHAAPVVAGGRHRRSA